MSEYSVEIAWSRGNQPFSDNKYSRRHEMRFDGGIIIPASSSPHIVPVPMSDLSAVDPEEALVAALSSCHMLVFLGIAAKRKFVVDEYTDMAVGVLEKNLDGKIAMTRVTLRPKVTFSGDRQPTFDQLETMHHQAHKNCFIANSVRTEVTCEPVSDSL